MLVHGKVCDLAPRKQSLATVVSGSMSAIKWITDELRQVAAKPALSMILSARADADIRLLVAARYLPTQEGSLSMSGWRQMSGYTSGRHIWPCTTTDIIQSDGRRTCRCAD